MKLELSKQYPFNFVALAFELLKRKLDERALAKFDAYEVDEFLQKCSDEEQKIIQWALSDDGASPPAVDYGRTLFIVASRFEQKYLDGHFSLVLLADFNNLAMSWAAVEKVVDKIDRHKDQLAAQRCLFDVRDILATKVLNAKSYAKLETSAYIDDSEIPVRDFAMDSYGRQLLLENNLNTVGKLTCVTADYLLSIKDFGETRLKRVRECLGTYGTHLLGES